MSVLQQWETGQANPEVPVNENFAVLSGFAVYARNPETTEGLTWGYYGGRWGGFAVTAGTLALTANATNYVVVNRSTGAISVSTTITNWNNTATFARVYLLTTGPLGLNAEPQDFRFGDGGLVLAQGPAGRDGVDGVGVPTGGTTGQILAKNSNTNFDTEWIDPPAGGGGSIAVSDEGTQITAEATSLNFTGAGVTATQAGGAVTVNIPGGGGGGGSSDPNFAVIPKTYTRLDSPALVSDYQQSQYQTGQVTLAAISDQFNCPTDIAAINPLLNDSFMLQKSIISDLVEVSYVAGSPNPSTPVGIGMTLSTLPASPSGQTLTTYRDFNNIANFYKRSFYNLGTANNSNYISLHSALPLTLGRPERRGGFYIKWIISPSTAAAFASRRFFAGVANDQSNVAAGVNPSVFPLSPSAPANKYGLGFDTEDTTWVAYSGTIKQTISGITKLPLPNTTVYQIEIYSKPRSNTVGWRIKAITGFGANDFTVISGTFDPAGGPANRDLLMFPHCYTSVGGASSAIALNFHGLYVEHYIY